MDSFKSWPRSIPINPLELCVAGLFYTGVSDKVICPACNVYVQNCTSTDIPLKKHRYACKFVSAFKELQKYSNSEERLKTLRELSTSHNVINVEDYARAGFYYLDGVLRFITDKDISLYKTRVQSFEGFPKQAALFERLNEKKAARNGFLYSEVGSDVYTFLNAIF